MALPGVCDSCGQLHPGLGLRSAHRFGGKGGPSSLRSGRPRHFVCWDVSAKAGGTGTAPCGEQLPVPEPSAQTHDTVAAGSRETLAWSHAAGRNGPRMQTQLLTPNVQKRSYAKRCAL